MWYPGFTFCSGIVLCTNCYMDMYLQLDKKVAERRLREHKGDAIAAIRSLLV